MARIKVQAKVANMKRPTKWLFVDVSLRLLAAGLGFFRLFGVVFFASTTELAIAMPAIALLVLASTPIRFLSLEKLSMKLILSLYLLSYFFGGFQRILEFHKLMPDVLELVVVLCFCVFAWKQNRRLS